LYYINGKEYNFTYQDDRFIAHGMFGLATLGPSLFFIANWLSRLRVGVLTVVYLQNIKIFNCLTLNMVDPNKFNREHIAASEVPQDGDGQEDEEEAAE